MAHRNNPVLSAADKIILKALVHPNILVAMLVVHRFPFEAVTVPELFKTIASAAMAITTEREILEAAELCGSLTRASAHAGYAIDVSQHF
jgi:hypothetical protein